MPQELMVVGFSGCRRAPEVLGELQRLDDQSTADLADAVAAYRTDDGSLRVDQSVQPRTRDGADWSILLGGMLGTLLAAPVGDLSASAAGSWKERYGIPDDFVSQIAGLVGPGESAVLALIASGSPDTVAERFRGYGGKILRARVCQWEADDEERTIGG